MSEKPTPEKPEKLTPSDQELDQRLEDFTRRGLLRVGWVTPIVVSAALPAHAAPSHIDNPHIDNYVDVPHEDEPHTDEPHTDEPHTDEPHDDHEDSGHEDEPHVDEHVDEPHTDEPHEDEPACEGTGGTTCDPGGENIAFTATAVMTAWSGDQCNGDSTQWSSCCDEAEAETVAFMEPCEATVTVAHNHPTLTLKVKVDYFTFANVGCTNSSSFAEYVIGPGEDVAINGSVQGDAPECTGFRIVEVKVEGGPRDGEELCKPDPCPEGDLGIYAVLYPEGSNCTAPA